MNLDESMQVISEMTCYVLEMKRLMQEAVADAPAKKKKGFGRVTYKTAGDVARELHNRLSNAETEHHNIIKHAETHRYHSPAIDKLHHSLGAIRGYKDMLKLATVALHHPKARQTAYQGTQHAAKMLAGEHKHLLHPETPEDLAKKGENAGWRGRGV